MLDFLANNWILVTLAAALFGTFSGFTENYMIDVSLEGKKPQSNKVFSMFVFTIAGIVVLAASGGIQKFELDATLMAIFCGVLTGLLAIFYELALISEESTSAKIFSQISPVFYLILGVIFLGQKIENLQWVAFALILCAPIVTVIFGHSKRKKKLNIPAAAKLAIYNILCPVASLFLVLASNKYDFLTCFGLMLLGRGGINAILVLCNKSWRVHFAKMWKKKKMKLVNPMMVRFSFWMVAESLYRTMLSVSSVALVSVIYNAGTLFLTFFFGLLLSLLWPKYGREKLEKRTIIAHLISIVIATVGIILLNI